MTTTLDIRTLPSYEQPPITEVACSIIFNPLREMLSPHVGLLWHLFQPDYPLCDDVVPIAPRLDLQETQFLELSHIPPLPRVFFLSQDETRIIQIQRDLLAHNWKRNSSNSEYPRYQRIVSDFQKHLTTFKDFIKQREIGEVEPRLYELTYVNQIPQGATWSTLADIGYVFPDISWHSKSSRFLTTPQVLNWTCIFELPDGFGRLYASVKSTTIEEMPCLLFELTVRGFGKDSSLNFLQNWFDEAHRQIVCAFADLTNPEVQEKIWKRRK